MTTQPHPFDHGGTWRHHHDADTAEPIWWQSVEQFGGEKREHRHAEAALPVPALDAEGEFDTLTEALSAAEESGYRRGRKEALDERDE